MPMTWGDVDKAGGLPARSPAPPTPVLYLGDEDDADDGSAFGDDDVVPPPPPPLPSERRRGAPSRRAAAADPNGGVGARTCVIGRAAGRAGGGLFI